MSIMFHLKYHALSFPKIKKDVAEFVIWIWISAVVIDLLRANKNF